MRPPLCVERLTPRADGDYEYRFRKPWADGTEGLVLTPMELMERLAALVPIPRANLVRYHGVLAPASAWRARIVPREDEGSARRVPVRVPRDRVPWARLLARVWLVDVLRCTGCGGRRRVLAAVTNPGAIGAILLHLGLDPLAPTSVPARGPPSDQLDGWAS